MASPWSPPAWMKSNNSSIGGRLKSEYYDVYADYLIKYILSMKDEGIQIYSITVQNEPLILIITPVCSCLLKSRQTL